MSVPFNDLSRALRDQGEALQRVIAEVIASGWLVRGPHHAAFEAELAEFVGVGHACGVASGTDALELALRAVADGRQGSVVTAANAGGYTAVAARSAGLRAVFCDVDPITHCVDPSALASVLDESVVAVVVTHLYGRCAPLREVLALCEPRGIAVIEDCAQAIGAWSRDGNAGALGRLSTFSFYPTKNLGALGDGGAVVSDDAALIERVAQLGQYGWGEKYRAEVPGGRNSRLDELQAAVLRFRLPLVADGNQRRRAIVRAYEQAAPDSVVVLPADDGHAGHLAVVEVSAGADALATHLAESGIGSAVHYPVPDHFQPAFDTPDNVRLPVTESLVGRILTLPCYPEMTDAEVDGVAQTLQSFEPERVTQ